MALFELLTDFGDLKCHTPDLEREVSVRARRLLDEGVNPNALNAKGVSPLGMVGRVFIRTSEHVGKVIEALIKKGADPMSHDQAFLGCCKSKKDYVREEFVLCMVSEMCKKEATTGIRFQDTNGRNPLQVMASNNVYGASLTFAYLWDASGCFGLGNRFAAKQGRWVSCFHYRGDCSPG